MVGEVCEMTIGLRSSQGRWHVMIRMCTVACWKPERWVALQHWAYALLLANIYSQCVANIYIYYVYVTMMEVHLQHRIIPLSQANLTFAHQLGSQLTEHVSGNLVVKSWSLKHVERHCVFFCPHMNSAFLAGASLLRKNTTTGQNCLENGWADCIDCIDKNVLLAAAAVFNVGARKFEHPDATLDVVQLEHFGCHRHCTSALSVLLLAETHFGSGLVLVSI